MKYKVYIDGQEGTTGLQLQKRLGAHESVELLLIDEKLRKDESEREKYMNAADAVFLCLPDAAAKDAVRLVKNDRTVVIDASTAHRVDPAWTYGFPELSKALREKIALSKRIANPGCHATGFVSIAYPLVKEGIAGADYPFTCHSLTGYSGGGKKMIAQYEAAERDFRLDSPRQYGLTMRHKHLPEMQKIPGLTYPPVFNPIVCDLYSGMTVMVPLTERLLAKRVSAKDVEEMLRAFYEGQKLIEVCGAPEDGFLATNELSGTCRMRIHVYGNDGMITVASVFDNLGKGASGAAIQNMNIALGLDEYETIL